MMKCTDRLSLYELLNRPAAELRLVGAEDDDDSEDDLDDDKSDKTGDDDKGDKSGSDKSGDDKDDKSKGGKTESDPKDRKIQSLEEEKDRHYDLRKKAEARVTELESEIVSLKKDGTTDEALKTEITDLKLENKSLKSQNSDLALENAFLKDNTRTWIDPDAALKLADLSKVEIDSDGKVHGLSSALDKLATNSPYLLKVESDGDDKDDKNPKPKKTGDQPKSQKQGDEKSKASKEARYKAKYPGLRR